MDTETVLGQILPAVETIRQPVGGGRQWERPPSGRRRRPSPRGRRGGRRCCRRWGRWGCTGCSLGRAAGWWVPSGLKLTRFGRPLYTWG